MFHSDLRRCSNGRALFIGGLLLTTACTASGAETIIHAGRLLDGVDAEPRERVSIVIDGDRIAAVEAGFVERSSAQVIDLTGATVLPGLIDCHTHLREDRGESRPGEARFRQSVFDELLATVPVANTVLQAGFTSVRSVGDPDGDAVVALKRAIERGDIPGPRMWVALEPLGPTGGHSDPANGLDPSLSSTRWEDSVVDGADDVIARVRSHRKRGADLIKIMPSGGVTSVGDNPQLQLMTKSRRKALRGPTRRASGSHLVRMRCGHKVSARGSSR